MQITEPNAIERECAMGFEPGCTEAEGVSDLQRCEILGQAIDLNALFTVLTAAQVLHQSGLNDGVHKHVKPSHAVTPILTVLPAPSEHHAAELVRESMGAARDDVWGDEPVMAYLQNHNSYPVSRRIQRRAKSYVWFNDRLHCVLRDKYTSQTTFRQVPPPSVRDQIILNAHQNLGHVGEKRTIFALSTAYWWYGMTVDVKRVLSGCKLCARVRASGGHEPRDMQTQPSADYGMFHRWGIDFAQDLPTSAAGNSHCLILIDYFSKWVEAVPLPDLKASTAAAAFAQHVCARFGVPAEVITDNGPAFRGEFADYCARNFIHQRTITPDMARSNGLAERAVQTIKAALRKHVADQHSALTWDTEGLNAILLGYRCTPQAATGHSPARILFGLDPVIDAEQVYARAGAIDFSAERSMDEVTHELLQRAKLVAEIGVSVAHNLRTAHERDCRRFRAKRAGLYLPKVYHFLPGDYVFVLAQGQKPGGSLGIRARNEILKVLEVRTTGVLILQNQAGQIIEKHYEHCVPCTLPNLLGETHAGLAAPPADLPCQVCKDHRHWGSMLMCDNCDTGWHTFCLSPPLEDVPEGDWVCPKCMADGVTLESLAAKRQSYVADPQSRPNLEMPGRARLAKAQRLAEQWHGKPVVHVSKGRQRHARVVFQGPFQSKWFLLQWEDGTSTEHHAGILRHLHVIDETQAPATIPPIPEPVRILATFRNQFPTLHCWYAEPEHIQQFLFMTMSFAAAPNGWLLCMRACLRLIAEGTMPVVQVALEHVPILRTLWPEHSTNSCLWPVSGPLPEWCPSVFGTCVTNNPCEKAEFARTHFNPFGLAMHEFYGAGPAMDAYAFFSPPELLDLQLPLAHKHACHMVVAYAPSSYVRERMPHRQAWLASLRALNLLLFVHIMDEQRAMSSHGWLFLFAEPESRAQLMPMSLPLECSECVLEPGEPHTLVLLD